MHMNDREIQEILKRYQEGICSEEEKAWVESWYLTLPEDSNTTELHEPEMESAKRKIWKSIVSQRPNVSLTRRHIIKAYYKTAIAATILLTMGITVYFLNNNRISSDSKRPITDTEAIEPGGNKAYLTLADGKKINLSDKEDGTLLEQAGIRIIKNTNGELVYEASNIGHTDHLPTGNNTVETPIGGQYQVILPDGTKVWLNSSSSLEYPIRFEAHERRVTLHGEGYFEVKSDKRKPFRVVSKGQIIEVLGTKFNVNTYEDEPAIKTTLLEGSVKISLNNTSKILRPGEQATVVDQNIRVHSADTEQATAWYKGDFAFDGVELKNIMRQISRWYNVEVVYQGDVGNIKFGGSISRTKDINEVLNVLSMTKGVNFKLEGRRVWVMQ